MHTRPVGIVHVPAIVCAAVHPAGDTTAHCSQGLCVLCRYLILHLLTLLSPSCLAFVLVSFRFFSFSEKEKGCCSSGLWTLPC